MLDFIPATKRDFNESAVDLTPAEFHAGKALVSAFADLSIKVSCPEDQVLFQMGEEGNCVYLVQSGEVGLFLPISSTHAFAFRASTGCLVGLPAAFGDEPYSMTAVAWKGSELAVMRSAKFCNMIASNSALSVDVLKILAAETRAARSAIKTHLIDGAEL